MGVRGAESISPPPLLPKTVCLKAIPRLNLLFVIVIDVLLAHLRVEDLWELLFADDLATMAISADQLQERLVRWQERYGLKINAKKTKVL